jgi:hypothetical protein
VSSRPRRALVGLVVAAAAIAALPASALAAGETLAVTPANTQAGGLTDLTAALTFASGDTPKTVVTSLAPGTLGNLNANASCLLAQQLTSACQIGTATVSTNATPDITGNLYLVPAQGSDASGIEFVPPAASGLSNQYIGVALNPNEPAGLNLTTTFGQVAGVNITKFTANFTSLGGQEFTRLPSSCSAATNTASVTYYGATAAGTASGSFTPTGCASLPYAPTLSGTITRDKNDIGGTLAFGIDQAAGEAGSQTIVLTLPKGLSVNALADVPCLSGKGCDVGTATATSTLVPSVALSKGTVTLAGSALSPTITVAFPAPFAISLVGAVSLTKGTVTFNNVPDVPLTALNVDITGPNGHKAFNTNCTPGSVSGAFTSYSGATKTSTAAVKFVGCALKPTVTGSTAGLASGHPKLKFKVAHAKGGANIATVAIGVPAGLKFSRSAIVKHQTCTTKGKKKCTTTTLIKGLGVAGGKAKSVAIKGGKLVITLKKAAGTVTFTLSGPLVSETSALQTKVKKHKTKTLKFTVKSTDAKKASSTASLKLKAH